MSSASATFSNTCVVAKQYKQCNVFKYKLEKASRGPIQYSCARKDIFKHWFQIPFDFSKIILQDFSFTDDSYMVY
jgi:hypothetical protein